MAAWDVVLLDPVVVWYEGLLQADPLTAEQVAAALDLLEEFGPSLGRPLVDTLRGSLAEVRYAAWIAEEMGP